MLTKNIAISCKSRSKVGKNRFYEESWRYVEKAGHIGVCDSV